MQIVFAQFAVVKLQHATKSFFVVVCCLQTFAADITQCGFFSTPNHIWIFARRNCTMENIYLAAVYTIITTINGLRLKTHSSSLFKLICFVSSLEILGTHLKKLKDCFWIYLNGFCLYYTSFIHPGIINCFVSIR